MPSAPDPFLRLAYVTETYPPEINGVSLTVARTVTWLRERGHALDLIRPRQPHEAARDDAHEWRSAGCALPLYPDLRFGYAGTARLRRRFAQARTELVHLATPGPLAWSALWAARSLGVPVTSDFRTNFHQYSAHYGLRWLAPVVLAGLRRLHNAGRCTFVPTAAAADDLRRAGFERVEVVGRGIDTAAYTPERRSATLRAGWGAADAATPVLLYVGRLAAEKNVRLALRAYAAARLAVPETRLVVVGDGPLAGTLRRECAAARFVGVQRGADLAAIYASADIFLFPSLTDTFGNVTLEAMASGLPVLAFDVAAAGAHVETGASGWLIRPGDAAAYVQATVDAVQTRCWSDLGQQARAAVLPNSWDTVLTDFEARLLDCADADACRSTAAGCGG